MVYISSDKFCLSNISWLLFLDMIREILNINIHLINLRGPWTFKYWHRIPNIITSTNSGYRHWKLEVQHNFLNIISYRDGCSYGSGGNFMNIEFTSFKLFQYIINPMPQCQQFLVQKGNKVPVFSNSICLS